MKTSTLKGMTLTEMLVVLAIIGILILFAFPIYNNLIVDTRYKEAEINLKEIANFQEAYFFEHAKYADNLKEIHFMQQKLASEGGNAHFRYEIQQATNSDFKAVATAVTDFDGDGVYSIWEISKEGVPVISMED